MSDRYPPVPQLRNSQAGLHASTTRVGWMPPEVETHTEVETRTEWGIRYEDGYISPCPSRAAAESLARSLRAFGFKPVSRTITVSPWREVLS